MKTNIALLTCLCAGTSLASLPATASNAPDFGQLEVYQDWIVGCDNLRSCHAVSAPDYDGGVANPAGDGALDISIMREGGPHSAPNITFALNDSAPATPIDRARSFRVDSRVVKISFQVEGGFINLTDAAAFRLIAAMRNAESVAVADANGKAIASASLHGLKAALLYVDEQQLRVGTVSTLAKRGNKPANAFTIPPMPPHPVVVVNQEPLDPPVRLDEAKIVELTRKDNCRDAAAAASMPNPEYARLDPRTTLLLLPTLCMGYNPETQVFVIDNRGNVKPAPSGRHPWSTDDGDNDGIWSLPNIEWDRKERILSGYGKSRGLGDCGQILKFAWSKGQFRLVRYASMSECRGSYEYITTWRLEVRKVIVPEVPHAQPPAEPPPAPTSKTLQS